jgi:serine/threonine protein kinase
MFRIVEDDMPPLPEDCSPLLEDFLKQCFDKDPTKRPSADLLCEHAWLKKNWGAHKVNILRKVYSAWSLIALCLAGTTPAGQHSFPAPG